MDKKWEIFINEINNLKVIIQSLESRCENPVDFANDKETRIMIIEILEELHYTCKDFVGIPQHLNHYRNWVNKLGDRVDYAIECGSEYSIDHFKYYIATKIFFHLVQCSVKTGIDIRQELKLTLELLSQYIAFSEIGNESARHELEDFIYVINYLIPENEKNDDLYNITRIKSNLKKMCDALSDKQLNKEYMERVLLGYVNPTQYFTDSLLNYK